MPRRRSAAALLLAGGASGTAVTNCTQQSLSFPGARAAASVLGRYAVFALEAHADDANTGAVDIFDAATGAWRGGRMRGASRTNMCATSWRHLAVFAGGTAARGAPKSRAVDVWDSVSGLWSEYNMSIGRDLLGCASAGNYTVFAGGSAPQANQSETAEVDVWDHDTGVWSRAALSQPRKKPEAVAAGRWIVIAGGEVAKSQLQGPAVGGYSDVVDVFDTQTGVWTTTRLPWPPRQYFGAAAAGGRAVFAGGFYNDQRLGGVDVYDPADGSWSQAPPLSHNRSNLNAASMGGGRYAAFGSGNIDAAAKVAYDFYDMGDSGATAAAAQAHAPGNPAVAGVDNPGGGGIALFAGADGTVDAFAIGGGCGPLR